MYTFHFHCKPLSLLYHTYISGYLSLLLTPLVFTFPKQLPIFHLLDLRKNHLLCFQGIAIPAATTPQTKTKTKTSEFIIWGRIDSGLPGQRISSTRPRREIEPRLPRPFGWRIIIIINIINPRGQSRPVRLICWRLLISKVNSD